MTSTRQPGSTAQIIAFANAGRCLSAPVRTRRSLQCRAEAASPVAESVQSTVSPSSSEQVCWILDDEKYQDTTFDVLGFHQESQQAGKARESSYVRKWQGHALLRDTGFSDLR